MSVVEGPAYADALRAKMLGATLDADQREVLDVGRRESGYPPGRFPLPLSFWDSPDDAAVGVAFGPPERQPPPDPPARHRDRNGPTVADEVAATGLCPARAVHTFNPSN